MQFRLQLRTMALLAVGCLLTAFSPLTQAQSTPLSGVVTDANGTAIKGARGGSDCRAD
jgi:hypothetical protein